MSGAATKRKPGNLAVMDGHLVRMSTGTLDLAAARLEEIRLEEEKLRAELQEQVEEFGFTPPRAEKSKRLTGIFYELTVTRGLTTEIKRRRSGTHPRRLPGWPLRPALSNCHEIQTR